MVSTMSPTFVAARAPLPVLPLMPGDATAGRDATQVSVSVPSTSYAAMLPESATQGVRRLVTPTPIPEEGAARPDVRKRTSAAINQFLCPLADAIVLGAAISIVGTSIASPENAVFQAAAFLAATALGVVRIVSALGDDEKVCIAKLVRGSGVKGEEAEFLQSFFMPPEEMESLKGEEQQIAHRCYRLELGACLERFLKGRDRLSDAFFETLSRRVGSLETLGKKLRKGDGWDAKILQMTAFFRHPELLADERIDRVLRRFSRMDRGEYWYGRYHRRPLPKVVYGDFFVHYDDKAKSHRFKPGVGPQFIRTAERLLSVGAGGGFLGMFLDEATLTVAILLKQQPERIRSLHPEMVRQVEHCLFWNGVAPELLPAARKRLEELEMRPRW